MSKNNKVAYTWFSMFLIRPCLAFWICEVGVRLNCFLLLEKVWIKYASIPYHQNHQCNGIEQWQNCREENLKVGLFLRPLCHHISAFKRVLNISTCNNWHYTWHISTHINPCWSVPVPTESHLKSSNIFATCCDREILWLGPRFKKV